MAGLPLQVPRPQDPDEFQRYCIAFGKVYLNCPQLAPFGGSGQGQYGIDLHGHDETGVFVSAQCKARSKDKLQPSEIDDDVRKAQKLIEEDGLKRIVFMTTASRDAKTDLHVTKLSASLKKSHGVVVEVKWWEDFQEFFSEHPTILEDLQPGLAPILTRRAIRVMESLEAQTTASGSQGERDLDAEITRAFQPALRGDPAATIARLESFREDQWSGYAPRIKYRILANLGNAHYIAGNWESAGEFYLKAREFSDSLDARVLEARAYMLQDNADKVRELSSVIIADAPDHGEAHANLIHLDKRPYREIDATIEHRLKDIAEVARALAHKAIEEGAFEEAVEHCRASLRAQPDWPEAKVQLATALLGLGRNPATFANGYPQIRPSAMNAAEANALILDAINSPSISRHAKADALQKQAVALRSLGDDTAAHEAISEAYRLAHSDRRIATAHAVSLLATGNRTESIRVLRHALAEPADDVFPELTFASVLLGHSEAEARESRDVLDRAMPVAAAMPVVVRFDYGELHCQSVFQANRQAFNADTLPITSSLDQLLLDTAHIQVLRAFWLDALGDKQAASDVIDAISQQERESLCEPASLKLAETLWQIDRSEEACRILRSRASASEYTPVTKYFLRSLVKAKLHGELWSLCERLTAAGITDRELVFQYARVAGQYERTDTGLAILKTWLVEHPDDIDGWVSAGNFAVDASDEEYAQQALEHLSAVTEIAPPLLEGVARLVQLTTCWSQQERADPIYRLWRANRNHLEGWRILVQFVFTRDKSSETDVPPDSVGPGVTAIYQYAGETQHRAISIVDVCDPAAEWREFVPTHAHAQAIMGKRIDDEIELPSAAGPRVGKIVQLQWNWQYAGLKCSNEMSTRFPESSMVEPVRLPEQQAPHSAEQITAVLKPFLTNAQRQREQTQRAVEAFATQPVPLWTLSRILGYTTGRPSTSWQRTIRFPSTVSWVGMSIWTLNWEF